MFKNNKKMKYTIRKNRLVNIFARKFPQAQNENFPVALSLGALASVFAYECACV